ncbi:MULTISPECIES: helix-turn-helix domain-containing protein [Enterococcus]|uniref:helix-turn-helix domain-containing protein n=1 Tax=Enterococcus TaxID=1350 RepID=UPI001A9B1A58|nr:helix-turn-helix transcriptional regulator [Enterococcus mundtii]MBO1299953.1 helix-turn-helix transcriptional regulator [Enterococcus sp. DIV1271a]
MKETRGILINQRLAQLRKERFLTLDDVSNIFEPPVSKGTVSNWENGHQYPSNKRIVALCDFYDVSIDYLYGRTEDRNFTNENNKKNSLEIGYE